MKVETNEPPREFRVGVGQATVMTDCARIALDDDEQVTFMTEAGGEYDVARKSWGFYATPSLNGRLPKFGLRPVVTRNEQGQYYILLVEQGREPDFEEYARVEEQTICGWLDESATLQKLEEALKETSHGGG